MLALLPGLHLGIAFLLLPHALAFDRATCLEKVQGMLDNHNLTSESSYFYRDSATGQPYTDASNMTLTLAGCNMLCGSEQSWYSDVGPRLGAWIIPVLLLLINVEVSPFGKRSPLEYIHLLGDPIDSLWSLINTIDMWDRCHIYAARYPKLCPSCRLIVATVFAGYGEVLGPRIEFEHIEMNTLTEKFRMVEHFDAWRRAAVQLAGKRTDPRVRTLLAVLLYIYQLVSNFVPAVGGPPTSPPGNRIATAVLLSCFIPSIILTNAAGTFTTRRSSYDTMVELSITSNGHSVHIEPQESYFLRQLPFLARKATGSDYDDALPWAGGVSLYRPWKLSRARTSHSSFFRTFSCCLLASLPVLIGFLGGSLLLWWQTPRGFNCRHIWMIAVSVAWMVSAFITTMTYRPQFATGRYHWRFVLIKDACVALPSFAIFILSTSGLFNYCWCWSGPRLHAGTGRVVLPVRYFDSDGTVMYPTTLGTALALQLLVVATIMYFWRRAFRLLRWKGAVFRAESDRVLGSVAACKCISNMGQSLRCSDKAGQWEDHSIRADLGKFVHLLQCLIEEEIVALSIFNCFRTGPRLSRSPADKAAETAATTDSYSRRRIPDRRLASNLGSCHVRVRFGWDVPR